ncbi:MAG TPA: sigma-70 region 4 domain-containing protein [Acidimicrobiales bacterium]
MERDEAVAQLPVVYQRVLAWLDQGWSGEQIATRLGIDPRAVDPLIRLAEAKLARLTDATTGNKSPTTDGAD